MKRLVIFLIWILASSFVITADDPLIATLKARLAEFERNRSRAKLDLLFHQPEYSPGDTAFVRTLYLNANNLKPVEERELIHVELYDPSGKRVVRDHFITRDGFSSNKLFIPATLNPGIYTIVAFSNWMLNGDLQVIYHRDFVITGKNRLIKESETADPRLEFYPEGGYFVAGVRNYITIHRSGDARFDEVIIRDRENEVARASFNANDLATVSFVPKELQSYRAEVNREAIRKEFPLPTPITQGVAIHVDVSSGGMVNVHLQASGSAGFKSKNYYLTAISNEGLLYYDKIRFDETDGVERQLPSGLPAGIVQLTLVDEGLNALVKRVVLLQNQPAWDFTFGKLANNYPTRSGVDVEIQIRDKSGRPATGNFSVSVLNNDIFGDSTDRAGTYDNLMLYSDIGSTFRLKAKTDQRGTLEYLTTQICPWLVWDEIRTGKIKRATIPPQTTLNLKGSVLQGGTDNPVADSTVVMFFFEKQMLGYERIIINGKFDFPILFDFSGSDNVLFMASRKGKDVNNIVIHLDQADSLLPVKAQQSIVSLKENKYGKFSADKAAIDRSYSFFSNKVQGDSIADPNLVYEKELGGADVIFRTEDYLIFPTMEDVIREVLPAVDYRKIRGRNVIRVYTTEKLPGNETGPLYAIDGVLTKDPEAFLTLRPTDIITIKIINKSSKLVRWRSLGANGVILVNTKKPDETAERVRPDNVMEVLGSASRLTDDESTTARKPLNTPDFKPQLKWASNVKLDKNGKAVIHFNTADDATRYRIFIDGLTTDGIPFSTEKSFEVHYTIQP